MTKEKRKPTYIVKQTEIDWYLDQREGADGKRPTPLEVFDLPTLGATQSFLSYGENPHLTNFGKRKRK